MLPGSDRGENDLIQNLLTNPNSVQGAKVTILTF